MRVSLLLLFALTGCATWRPFDAGSTLRTARSLPYRLRVTRPDSTRVTLTEPFARGDTLYGRVQRNTLGVPIGEIAGFERERVHVGRTLGVVIGVPAVALGLTYLIVCGDSQCQATY